MSSKKAVDLDHIILNDLPFTLPFLIVIPIEKVSSNSDKQRTFTMARENTRLVWNES